MGELKDLRAQQEQLLSRAKELGNKLYLAGLGAITKAETGSTDLLDKYVSSGSKALGDSAEGKPMAVLAGFGAIEAAKEAINTAPDTSKALYDKFLQAGSAQRGEKAEATNEYLLAGLGAMLTARSESEKLFNELVSTGEKRA